MVGSSCHPELVSFRTRLEMGIGLYYAVRYMSQKSKAFANTYLLFIALAIGEEASQMRK